jgi:transcriptional regulator with XRE-family HTH domain
VAIVAESVAERTYSRPTMDAARVLGLEIAQARRERRWTAAELGERAGISPVTMRKVERGDPSVSIGIVFEVATLVGVRLFDANPAELASLVERGRDRLALLPARVRTTTTDVFDAF